MHGGFWPGLFAIFPSADWRTSKQALQFSDDVNGGCVAVEQLNEPVFDGMVGDGVIDPLGSSVLCTLLGQGLLSWFGEQCFEIAEQQCREKVLANSFGGLSAEILQFQPALHQEIKSFLIPP